MAGSLSRMLVCGSYKAVCKRTIGTWITRPINEYKRYLDAVFTRWNGCVVCHQRQNQSLWLNYRRARNRVSFKFAIVCVENCVFIFYSKIFLFFSLFLFPPSVYCGIFFHDLFSFWTTIEGERSDIFKNDYSETSFKMVRLTKNFVIFRVVVRNKHDGRKDKPIRD